MNIFSVLLHFGKKNTLDCINEPRSRQYLLETITDADYTDDLVLLRNIPTQPKFLLHSLE